MSRILRREFVAGCAAAAVAVAQSEPKPGKDRLKQGRLKQGLTRGVFATGTSFDEMCRAASELGCYGFDLVPSRDWPTLKKYGLIPTMAPPNAGVTIASGLNEKDKHDAIEKTMRPAIDECAANGCPNLITVSGNRRGLTDEAGIDNCVAFLNRMKAQAEDKAVTICFEPINSVDYPDQQCDRTEWAAEVCKRVNSPRVKILLDLRHRQIMQGNVATAIRDNFQWIAHFHLAGVPGSHEIDETQELNYAFVAKTIADLGFTGYVTHEYRPAAGRNAMESLRLALAIIDAA
jgi:hydroxypyruvate isomerase